MPPFLGQGANQAIADAYCLANELKALREGSSSVVSSSSSSPSSSTSTPLLPPPPPSSSLRDALRRTSFGAARDDAPDARAGSGALETQAGPGPLPRRILLDTDNSASRRPSSSGRRAEGPQYKAGGWWHGEWQWHDWWVTRESGGGRAGLLVAGRQKNKRRKFLGGFGCCLWPVAF